jgi:hypothetical protein
MGVLLCSASLATADFTAYTNGQSNTTFAHYDNFLLCDGTYPGPFTNADLGTFHPARIPDVRLFETTGLGFVTGSGNIYSFDTPTEFNVIAASYNRIGYSTRVWLQFKTLGSELQYDGITLSYKDDVGQKILTLEDAVQVEEIYRGPDGFGGFDVETLVVFEFPYNPRTCSVNFAASGPSMSFAAFRIDTQAFPTP